MTSPTREPRTVIADTPRVLLKSKDRGFLPEIRPLISELVQGGIHLSKALVQEALQIAGET